MREYTVYFYFFGRKMKTKVIAKTEAEAQQQVIDKLVFIKVEADKSAFNSIIEGLEETINMFPKK